MNKEPYSDKELFSLITEGNEKAFEILFHQYVPKITAFAIKITQERAIAEGIVQETFLKLWLGRDQLPGIENPSAWIYRIAANQCYKVLRRKVLAEQSQPAGHEENLQDTVDLRELNSLVKEAVSTLSGQRHKVYMLSREAGMTIPQIAVILELSPSTVKNTLVSALKSVRDYLEERGYMLPLVLLFWIK